MKVLLLAGGDSSEKQVSLNTGAAIYESLKRQGHDVLAIDPDGRSLLDSSGRYLTAPASNSAQSPIAVDSRQLALTLASPDCRNVDVIFIALHGGSGENGTIQSLLDLAGVHYTGSGMTASAVAMNKAMAKRLFVSEDIPTPTWRLFRCRAVSDQPAIAAEVQSRFGLPVIVKPNNSGSTVGLSKVKSVSELPGAIEKAAKESPDILVETFIAGRELTVAVLDGEALPVVEIRPKNELYDYEAKYTKGKSEYLAPAPLAPETAKAVQEAAEKAYHVIGCAGLARVDFILADDGSFYCLEVNTLPGMTNLSLAPMAAKCVGINFDELVSKILHSAIEAPEHVRDQT